MGQRLLSVAVYFVTVFIFLNLTQNVALVSTIMVFIDSLLLVIVLSISGLQTIAPLQRDTPVMAS